MPFGWLQLEGSVRGKDYAACHVVLQFPDVPRPLVTNQGFHDLLGEGIDDFVHGGGELLDEIPHKLWNIRFSLAQRRQRDRKSIQAIIKIFPEFTVVNHLPQVPVRRHDHTNIDARGARAADRLKLALLEHAEYLGLKFQRHVTNLIQKQRAAIGHGRAPMVKMSRRMPPTPVAAP